MAGREGLDRPLLLDADADADMQSSSLPGVSAADTDLGVGDADRGDDEEFSEGEERTGSADLLGLEESADDGDGDAGEGKDASAAVRRPPSARLSQIGNYAFVMRATRALRRTWRDSEESAYDAGRVEEFLADSVFGVLKGLATSDLGPDKLQFGDLLQAFRLYNFKLTGTAVALKQQVEGEEILVREFQYHLGKVIDIMDRKVSSFSVVWNEEREQHPLSREQLYELYCVLRDPNLVTETSFMRDVLRLGRAHCDRLRELFFHHDIEHLCEILVERREIFGTLFMHFEVNTESGDQDAQLSMPEVLEMLQVLGFEPETLGLTRQQRTLLSDPSESDQSRLPRYRRPTPLEGLAAAARRPSAGTPPSSGRGDSAAAADRVAPSAAGLDSGLAQYAVTPTSLNILSARADAERALMRDMPVTDLLGSAADTDGAGAAAALRRALSRQESLDSARGAASTESSSRTLRTALDPQAARESRALQRFQHLVGIVVRRRASLARGDLSGGWLDGSEDTRTAPVRWLADPMAGRGAAAAPKPAPRARAAAGSGSARAPGDRVGTREAVASMPAEPPSLRRRGTRSMTEHPNPRDLLFQGLRALEKEQEAQAMLAASLDEQLNPWMADTPASKIHRFFKSRGMRELDRPAFASLCLYLMSPSADPSLLLARATLRSRGPTAGGRTPAEQFAFRFRHRMCLLFESAEGIESTIDSTAFLKYASLAWFFPFAFLLWLRHAFRKQRVLGRENAKGIMTRKLGLRRAVASYVLGTFGWVGVILPPLLALGHDWSDCASPFEIFFPLLCFTCGTFGTATYMSYRARAIRPGTFKRHRLAVEVRGSAVVQRHFESGADRVVSAMDYLKHENDILRRTSRRRHRSGLFLIIEATYVSELTRFGRFAWMVATGSVALLVAVLPSSFRGGRHARADCPAGARFSAAVYTITGFLSILGLSIVLVRIFVQLVHIRRSWNMFSGMHNPIKARERKQRSRLIRAAASQGRLNGFLDLRKPENVRGWSKIRLYLQLLFMDELRGVEIFLAYVLGLFLVVLAALGVCIFLPARLESKFELDVALLIVVAAGFAIPLMLVLYNGVAINEQLRRHIGLLARARHNVEEELGEIESSFGARGSLVRMLTLSRRMLGSLMTVLKESDQPLRVLGLELSLVLVRTLAIALVTSIATTLGRTFNADL